MTIRWSYFLFRELSLDCYHGLKKGTGNNQEYEKAKVCSFCRTQPSLTQKGIFMITVKCDVFNISQESYDDLINSIGIYRFICPNCGHADMVIHGYYRRKVKTVKGILKLRIMRVKCKFCGKSHAILLSFIVPYSSILLPIHVRILFKGDDSKLMEEYDCIDESNIAYIRRMYSRHWEQRLTSENIRLGADLIDRCFESFHRQFMQIRCTINRLFSYIHTA